MRLSTSLSKYGPDLGRRLVDAPNDLLCRNVWRARLPVIDQLTKILELHQDQLNVQDVEAAARLIVSASEGVALNAKAEGFNNHLANELARMFEGYLTTDR